MVDKKFIILIVVVVQLLFMTSCSLSNNGVAEMEQKNDSNMPRENLDIIREKFTNLYNKWQDYINRPEVKISSRSESYTECSPYNDIINIGKPALPYLFEKLKEGKRSGWEESQFFLWYAIRDITEIDLTEDNKSLGEQEIAEKYIIWWETQIKK